MATQPANCPNPSCHLPCFTYQAQSSSAFSNRGVFEPLHQHHRFESQKPEMKEPGPLQATSLERLSSRCASLTLSGSAYPSLSKIRKEDIDKLAIWITTIIQSMNKRRLSVPFTKLSLGLCLSRTSVFTESRLKVRTQTRPWS